MQPILASLPPAWEVIVWDNSRGVTRINNGRKSVWLNQGWIDFGTTQEPAPRDLSVYGRYAAIAYASHDLIYVADDDCVTDPQQVVQPMLDGAYFDKSAVVCNMPQEFRHDFYVDHALVGFGACFHRDLPAKAFDRYNNYWLEAPDGTPDAPDPGVFHNTCDIVFTTLTPRVLVNVSVTSLPYASDPGRMWTTPGHQEERSRMLELALAVKR